MIPNDPNGGPPLEDSPLEGSWVLLNEFSAQNQQQRESETPGPVKANLHLHLHNNYFTKNFNFTPALAMTNFEKQLNQGLKPAFAMDPADLAHIPPSRNMFNNDNGARMLEAEKVLAINPANKSNPNVYTSSNSSISSHDDIEVDSNEENFNKVFAQIQLKKHLNLANKAEFKSDAVKYEGRGPSTIHNHNTLSEQAYNSATGILKTGAENVLDEEENEFLEILKKKKEERKERLKQRKIKLNKKKASKEFKKKITDNEENTAAFFRWSSEDIKRFLKTCKRFKLPLTISHIFAVVLGIYIGNKAATCSRKQ